MEIVVDERETKEFDRLFKESEEDIKVSREMLPIADFVCSSQTAVERKTRNDFESSVIDNRLFSQLYDLNTFYENVVLIVEGTALQERISREALLGAYSSTIVNYNTSIFFTRDKKGTADMILSIARYEQQEKERVVKVAKQKTTYNDSQKARSIVEMFPNIGPKLAKTLLRYFGSIRELLVADKEEIMEVEGIGEKRAEKIQKILDHDYDPDKDNRKT